MTVAELIDQLRLFNRDQEVIVKAHDDDEELDIAKVATYKAQAGDWVCCITFAPFD